MNIPTRRSNIFHRVSKDAAAAVNDMLHDITTIAHTANLIIITLFNIVIIESVQMALGFMLFQCFPAL